MHGHGETSLICNRFRFSRILARISDLPKEKACTGRGVLNREEKRSIHNHFDRLRWFYSGGASHHCDGCGCRSLGTFLVNGYISLVEDIRDEQIVVWFPWSKAVKVGASFGQ